MMSRQSQSVTYPSKFIATGKKMHLSYSVVQQDPSGILLAVICLVSEQMTMTCRRQLSLWLVTPMPNEHPVNQNWNNNCTSVEGLVNK